MCFYVYRGLGGQLAVISPLIVCLVFHLILVVILRHDFVVTAHLWSAGLAVFFRGLVTAGILYYYYYGNSTNAVEEATTQTATQIPTDEAYENNDENNNDRAFCSKEKDDEDSPSVTQASSFSVEQPPTTIAVYGQTITLDGRLWRVIAHPMGTDHFCYVAPNRIAAAYMVLGVLLIGINLLQIVLAPVGGLFATLLWMFLIGFGYFLKVIVCATHNDFDNLNHDNDNTTGMELPTQQQQDPEEEEDETTPSREIV